MYNVIKVCTDNENGVELRLAEINDGYSVGVWDLDCNEYYPGMKIFQYTLENSLEKATTCFEEFSKKTGIEFTL